ncbi:MAG TPA: hypothetical protein VFU71_20455 [Burkholderiaceae bacterium]|nr:hypothetical protein [Burkholderiaceae bacterium]
MTFIRTTAPDEADAIVTAMYLRQQSAWGFVPNYAKVFSHRPEVLARWGQLLAEIRRPMDRRRFELVTFAAAHELANSACALAHGKKLREFFGDDDIVAIAGGSFPDTLSAAERAMLRFARQVVRNAAGVTAAQVDELKAHGFSDAEVFDLAATAAGRAFFAKLLDALGVAPDSPFLDLESELREPLTVGRAIDERPCVTMPVPAP